jgi:uncharacterized membrane protein
MSRLISKQDEKILVEAIATAEKNTSGEIRVHFEKVCDGEVLERAQAVFALLKMETTELRNGVLIYLAEESKKFAIIGDTGINEKVSADFWDNTKNLMQDLFKQGKFTEGLKQGILMAGEQLKGNFPYQKNDSNELSNDISYG